MLPADTWADEGDKRHEQGHRGGSDARALVGGMRRRLDLAASLVGRPRVLFLDEPTHRAGPAQPPGGVAGRGWPGQLGGEHRVDHPVPGGGRPAADRIAVLDGGRAVAWCLGILVASVAVSGVLFRRRTA